MSTNNFLSTDATIIWSRARNTAYPRTLLTRTAFKHLNTFGTGWAGERHVQSSTVTDGAVLGEDVIETALARKQVATVCEQSRVDSEGPEADGASLHDDKFKLKLKKSWGQL